jgi:hypothetical protein
MQTSGCSALPSISAWNRLKGSPLRLEVVSSGFQLGPFLRQSRADGFQGLTLGLELQTIGFPRSLLG